MAGSLGDLGKGWTFYWRIDFSLSQKYITWASLIFMQSDIKTDWQRNTIGLHSFVWHRKLVTKALPCPFSSRKGKSGRHSSKRRNGLNEITCPPKSYMKVSWILKCYGATRMLITNTIFYTVNCFEANCFTNKWISMKSIRRPKNFPIRTSFKLTAAALPRHNPDCVDLQASAFCLLISQHQHFLL